MRMKLKFHEQDIDAFDGTWKKRSRDEKSFRIVCGGTTYDIYDLLSTLRFRYSNGKMKKSKINKWTTLNMEETAALHEKILNSEKTGRSIGLGNLYRRMAMLYPDGDLKVYSKEGRGTIIQLKIPQKEGKKDEV